MMLHGMPLFMALDLDLSIGGAQTCCIITGRAATYGRGSMDRFSSVFFDDADSSGHSYSGVRRSIRRISSRVCQGAYVEAP